MKIYVASSWRNDYQQHVVGYLKGLGHKVYDFKSPKKGNNGFSWREIDEKWSDWTTIQFREKLFNPIAREGFESDANAIHECDVLVLVLPCGKSAHLEAGFAVGIHKSVYAYIPNKIEPELMYSWFNNIFDNLDELGEELEDLENSKNRTEAYRF
jgi:hypothetical protein